MLSPLVKQTNEIKANKKETKFVNVNIFGIPVVVFYIQIVYSFHQIMMSWTVFGVLANFIGMGMVLSFPSSLLPALKAPDASIKTDLNTQSWLASSIGISSVAGFLGSSVIMDICGRKKAHAIMTVPAMLGWILIYFSSSVTTLMIGRLLCGFTTGATVTLGAMVIGEYTSPENRGLFLNLKTAATCMGALALHILGHYFKWRTVALLALVPSVTSFCNICTWPESPSWLAAKNRFQQSERSFYWLRGKSEKSVKEFEALIQAQKKRIAMESSETVTCTIMLGSFFKKFSMKNFVMPVLIIYFAFLLLEACGRHTFPAFALEIIGNVSGNKTNTFLYTVCMDILTTSSCVASSFLVKVLKRRTLLFFSGISSVIVLLSVSLYLYLVSTERISNDRAWIPLTMLVAYFILSNLGCTCIPLALLGEIFPLQHRSAGTAISGIVVSLNLMLALQMTPKLLVSINSYGTFTVYSVIMVVAIGILYKILPETKNRTLQEIEDYFNNGKFLDEDIRIEDEDLKTKMLDNTCKA